MEGIVKIFMTALALLIFNGAFAVVNAGQGMEDRSIRERLIDEEGVELLYAIDNYYTFIVGRLNSHSEDELTVVAQDAANRTILIRHLAPQPLVYKSPVVPSYVELAALANGEVMFAAATQDGGAKGDFRVYTGADVYQHITALCRKLGGEPVFLIPKNFGAFKRLTEISALEAFTYVADTDEEGAWEFACSGAKRFAVSKDYNYKHEASEAVSFHMNRGLEGISYIKDGQAPDAWFAAEEANGLMKERIIAEAAVEAADMEMDFVKVKGGIRLEAKYGRGTFEGCHEVSVNTKPKNTIKGRRQVQISQFKVCGEETTMISQRVEEEPRIAKARIVKTATRIAAAR